MQSTRTVLRLVMIKVGRFKRFSARIISVNYSDFISDDSQMIKKLFLLPKGSHVHISITNSGLKPGFSWTLSVTYPRGLQIIRVLFTS